MTSVSTDRRQGVSANLGFKAPVKAATTSAGGNTTLSGTQTIDGIALVADDRVLVKDQTDGIENGIYEVNSGTWSRAPDWNGSFDIVQGTMLSVAQGTENGGNIFRVTTADPITIGTTSVTLSLSTNAISGVSAFMETMLDDTNGGQVMDTIGITAYAQGILNDDDAAEAQATLELGTAALVNTGISSAAVPTNAQLEGTLREYTLAQSFNATTLTDAATIAWDLSLNQVTSVTLAGNRTLGAPTNQVDGTMYVLRVIQDGTGTRTLAYNAVFKFPGGTAPTLSTGAGAIDILTFLSDGTNMYGVAQLDFS